MVGDAGRQPGRRDLLTRLEFPDGKRFAFTIIDDTDVATVENIEPVYRLLHELGMRTTKTVWPVSCPEGSADFSASQTLEDPAYRDLMIKLHAQGFEMAFHGATMESSTRERTLNALEKFRETFGSYPRVHANHAFNRENLYWGADRIDNPLLNYAYGRLRDRPADYYGGHVEGSPWWWGDVLTRHITYVRNLTFREVNLLRINPSLPYHDPRRPLVPWWFSATDADNRDAFVALMTPEALDRLEAEGGVCILATHLGKGYAAHGAVRPEVAQVFENLSRRNGWFVPVGTLLDWLRERRERPELPGGEWRRMQWRWARDLAQRPRAKQPAKQAPAPARGEIVTRFYRQGDEPVLVGLWNESFGGFSGAVARTVEFWRWCIAQRPGIAPDDIIIAERQRNILGYGVAEPGGTVLEMAVRQTLSATVRRETANLLITELEAHYRNRGTETIRFTLPGGDKAVLAALAARGYRTDDTPDFQLVIVDAPALFSGLLQARAERLKAIAPMTVHLKSEPGAYHFWPDPDITVTVGETVTVERGKPRGAPDAVVTTDASALTNIVFCRETPEASLEGGHVAVEPRAARSRILALLRAMVIEGPWYLPKSDAR